MEFRVLPIKDKELFLRYAIPCGEVLVGRGELRKELLDKLNDSVSHGQEIEIPVEEVFKVASRMCTIIARQMGKREIDSEVIRRYFLLEHEKAIRWRKQTFPDISVRECKVYPGKVILSDSKGAIVKTPVGERKLKGNFVKKLKTGDWVSTHYDYIPERIRKHHAEKMIRNAARSKDNR
jgi:hydrogenase maturation factor